jgi:hypothetical protein
MDTPVVPPVVGFALAGGGAKGSFEVGAVRYLYDHGVTPNIICGTSVGSINAIKLAEGEPPKGTVNSSRGLAGLEAIWLNKLKRNEDMYVASAWLNWLSTNAPTVYAKLPVFLLAPEAETAPDTVVQGYTDLTWLAEGAVSALGLMTGPAGLLLAIGFDYLAASGALADASQCPEVCQNLKAFLDSIDKQKPKSLYELSPVQQLLQDNLDLTKVQQWVSGGGKLRFAAVALESGKLRYITESGQVLERDDSKVVFQLPSANTPVPFPDLRLAVIASAAIPAFFLPVKLGSEN